MRKFSEDKLAIGWVAAIAVWALAVLPVVLPALALASASSSHSTFWEHLPHWFVALFTAVLAVSTILLWRVTSQGIRIQTNDTRIIQRAYLSVRPEGIHVLRDRSLAVAHIDICNKGNLPATNTKWTILQKFSTDDRLNDFPIDESKAEGENTVPPGVEIRQGGPEIEEGESGLRLHSGLYLYVWGAVFYEDGFGKRRITRYCHRYNCANLLVNAGGGLNWGQPAIVREHARYHRYGNDAD